MKHLACIALAVATGCAGDDDYPIVTQGPPPVIAGDDVEVMTFAGRVCRSDDLRELSTCTQAGTGGLAVTLSTTQSVETTTTAADGSFTLPVPTGTNPIIEVSGPGVVPTATPLPTSATVLGPGTIQVVDADLYARMLTSNGVSRVEGTGAILTTVTRDGVPATGITVATAPGTDFGPFYDASSPVTWGLGGTATRGVIWVPGLTAGMVDLAFESVLGGLETTVAGVQVRNGGVTILDTVLPGTIP